jgi:cytoskeleton protein RodZ
MSDTSIVDVADMQTPTATPPVLTAGAMLRAARESAGLHVAALAVSMKVPVKKLEALESDRLDLLPDAVFVRALASSVCRSLKIDAAPVLAKLPENGVPRLDAGERGINAPFRASGDTSSVSLPSFLKRPAALVVMALLIAAVVVVMVPEFQIEKVTTAAPDNVSVEPVQNPQAEAIAPSDVAVTAAMPNVPSAAPATEIIPPNTVAAPVPVQAAVVPPAVPVVAAPVTPVEPVASVPSDMVVFRARGPSWIEVTDAKGNVQVRRMLAAGETTKATGASPLAVVVGRADLTDVEVRGKAFNVVAIARDNVARFEVK